MLNIGIVIICALLGLLIVWVLDIMDMLGDNDWAWWVGPLIGGFMGGIIAWSMD
jgi:glycerol uptake facilitator-like aquaporin